MNANSTWVLFGYGRSLDGVGGVTLPRAIGFTASLYSIGVPPELLGLAALTDVDLAFVREVYPSLDEDISAALRFTNERHVKEFLGEPYTRLVGQFAGDIDRVHGGTDQRNPRRHRQQRRRKHQSLR